MSQLSTTPVLKCTRCGRSLVLTHLSTAESDYSGEKLLAFMKSIQAKALCRDCKRARLYYIKEGRLVDWEACRP